MIVFRKAMLMATSFIIILSIINGATGMQILPFILLAVLAYEHSAGRNVATWIVVLSIVMAILNFIIYSWVDVAVWGLLAISYTDDNK